MSSAKGSALLKLLRPRSVAVIGGDSAAEVIRQCRAIGFEGEISAVNPGRDELAGVTCVPSVAELGEMPDASFIAAPPEQTLDVVRELAKHGAPGAVCFAAGFAETGDSGAALQSGLRDAAEDMAVLGPNCHGYVNYLDGVALWPDDHGGQRCESGVALISQSGNIAINLTSQQRGLDIAYVISIGNSSTLGMHDYIDAMLEDDRVTAIGLHIEGLTDVRAFSEAAIRALHKGVPIVVFKAGRSEQGARIALSHTASLAGNDRLYSALFERVGVGRCNTLSQFIETLKFVSIAGPVETPTLGSMSCSGGDAAIVADTADSLGVKTPPFSDESTRRLRDLLGPNVSVANPIDYHLYIWGDVDNLTRCFSDVMSNGFGCTLLVLDYPQEANKLDESCRAAEQALLNAIDATGHKAVIVASLPENMPARVRKRLKAAGIAPMQGIEDCVFAFHAATKIGAAWQRAGKIRPVLSARKLRGDTEMLDEWESKQRLSVAGVQIPDGRICTSSEVEAAAREIGGRLVLKAVSNTIAHKHAVGGVVLGLERESDILDATYRLSGLSDKILVEELIEGVIAELIVGVSYDETFGLSLLVGTGGSLVELVDDTVSLLLPADHAAISSALERLKISGLIREADRIDATVDTIARIAEFAIQNADSLRELDVNPLLVTAGDAVAADALIVRDSGA